MEYLNVYDDNLSLLNKKVKRGEQLPPNEHILITIIYIENNNHEFLIQKTSPEKSGLYSSTGGHVQYKENSKQTIIREVFEELGVDISKTPDAYKISVTKPVQRRKHKKRRINKKWLKKYGYKIQVDLRDGWHIKSYTDGHYEFAKGEKKNNDRT